MGNTKGAPYLVAPSTWMPVIAQRGNGIQIDVSFRDPNVLKEKCGCRRGGDYETKASRRVAAVRAPQIQSTVAVVSVQFCTAVDQLKADWFDKNSVNIRDREPEISDK